MKRKEGQRGAATYERSVAKRRLSRARGRKVGKKVRPRQLKGRESK